MGNHLNQSEARTVCPSTQPVRRVRGILTVALFALYFLASTGSAQARDIRQAENALQAGKPRLAIAALKRPRSQEAKTLLARALLLAGEVESGLEKVRPFLDSQTPQGRDLLRILVGALWDVASAPGLSDLKRQHQIEVALKTLRGLDPLCRRVPVVIETECALLLLLKQPVDARKVADAFALVCAEKAYGTLPLAYVLESEGKVSDAIGALLGRIGNGDDARVLARAAAVHLRAGQGPDAHRSLLKALKQPVLMADTLRDVESVLLGLPAKEILEAARVWTTAHPKSKEAHWFLGLGLEGTGKADEALKAYETSWDLSEGTSGRAALGVAWLRYSRDGDSKEVGELLVRAIQLGAGGSPTRQPPLELLLSLAAHRMSAGQPQGALDLLRGVVEFHPDHATLQQNLGFLLREEGSRFAAKRSLSKAKKAWKESVRHYELASQAIRGQEHPASTKAQILNDTAILHLYHLKNLRAGERLLKEALEHDGQYLNALENMGVLELKRRRWKKAIGWFDQVLQIDAERLTSKDGKAVAESQLNRRR